MEHTRAMTGNNTFDVIAARRENNTKHVVFSLRSYAKKITQQYVNFTASKKRYPIILIFFPYDARISHVVTSHAPCLTARVMSLPHTVTKNFSFNLRRWRDGTF